MLAPAFPRLLRRVAAVSRNQVIHDRLGRLDDVITTGSRQDSDTERDLAKALS
jgi:hypothetical protein